MTQDDAVPDAASAPRLTAQQVTLSYDGTSEVAHGLDLQIIPGSFTVIIGPNGCGKSTLLRAFARLLKPVGGSILLDGKDIRHHRPKETARRIGLLPQSSTTPDGITVAELVARGRYPYQRLFHAGSTGDDEAVRAAMEATGVADHAERPVDQLSGGQRQRVWVAMALAQQTPALLLDEPTTFLDIGYQIELLDLFARLHREGRTMVAVLHDLNHAARYATHLVVMHHGAVVAHGAPADVVTAELVEEVFGLSCIVVPDPITGTPLIVPRASHTPHAAPDTSTNAPGPTTPPTARPPASRQAHDTTRLSTRPE